MPLDVKLTPKLTYKLRLSPQMRLSLNLLQMPLTKLKEYVVEEIEKNPLLEPINNIISNVEEEKIESEMPWTEEDEQKWRYRQSLITAPITLQEHLLRQLRLIAGTDEEHKIGELIIGNINDNGYLTCSIEDIAEYSKPSPCAQGLGKATKSQVEKVLALIQTFDPVGVGARNLRECLLLQLKARAEENSLAGQIVDKYLPCLEKKRYKYIAKKLSARGGSAFSGKVSVERIKEAVKEIVSLEPKPGRTFSTERTLHIMPDAVVKKNKDSYEVILNDRELPAIKINEKYKNMTRQKDTSADVRQYLLERLNMAKALIGAMSKRRETMQKVIEDIVAFQKDFLDKGLSNFKPMNLSQIAKRISKHKSTVSRAIANKYLHTPYGILELRNFLNSGIKQNNGEVYSSKTIKLKIKDLIENENKEKPLTDQEITDHFKQEGIFISRRTVTKYRSKLKILPSQSRRE